MLSRLVIFCVVVAALLQVGQAKEKKRSRPARCDLPIEQGPCRARKPVWGFDKEAEKCVKFFYGGCRGNKNRFKNKRQCQKRCRTNKNKKPTNVCELDKDTGPCRAYIERYYFNRETGSCETFVYGGCQGNENNFETKSQCERKCAKNICQLPKETGPCRAAFNKFYYDSKTKSCRSFVYGGCRGNANNFDTQEECEAKCA